MRRLILPLALLIGIPTFSNAQIPTNGFLAYYPFNGNADDESGNGRNGTVTDATPVNDRHGVPNSAYNFNGTSSKMTTTGFNVPVNNFSVCLWLNTPTSSGASYECLIGCTSSKSSGQIGV